MIQPYGDNVLVLMDPVEVSQGGIVLVQTEAPGRGRHKGTSYGAKRPNSGGVGGDLWWGTVLAIGPKVEGVSQGELVLTWYLAGEPLEAEQLERWGFPDLSADVRLIRIEAIELVRAAEDSSPASADTPALPPPCGPGQSPAPPA